MEDLILDEFYGNDGQAVKTSPEVRRKLAKVLGRYGSDETWRHMVAHTTVLREDEFPLQVPVHIGAGQEFMSISWILTREDGSIMTGSQKVGSCLLLSEKDGFEKRQLQLDILIPPGYHKLRLKFAGASPGGNTETLIIVAPRKCYLPEGIEQKCFGFSLQLYSLRSKSNWGIGDFTDLQALISQAQKLGADFIGLNPLNVLFLEDPEFASPYAAASRHYLNPLYIDVTAILEAKSNTRLEKYMASGSFQSRLEKARSGKYVNYTLVSELKLEALKMLYEDFLLHDVKDRTPRALEFQKFCNGRGRSLDRLAIFQTLSERLNKPGTHGFSKWPEAYRSPDSEEVREFARENKVAVGFYLYLQWIAFTQFERCKTENMKIGLYFDMPVGVSTDSADVWSAPDIYAKGACIGSPPDAFSPDGQCWGLSPMLPQVLPEKRYQPFIDILRDGMRGAGALRIDHVMGLFRTYWVLSDNTGAYVLNPISDFMAILALESHRHQCMVIGENLGTVPWGFNDILSGNNILGMKIFRYIGDSEINTFPPYAHEPLNLVAFGTHDMSTLKGQWTGAYIHTLKKIGHLDHKEHVRAKQELREWKINLIRLLAKRGFWFNEDENVLDDSRFPQKLTSVLYRYLSHSPCYVLSLSLEDLLEQEDCINIPGTVTEHPNWRRKLDVDVCGLASDKGVAEVCRAVKGS